MSEPRGPEGTTPLPVLEKPPREGDPPEASGTGEVHRFWSARRVPAAIVAAALFVVTGAFLYDVCAVRAGRPALAWRRELATQLAERPLDDTWVLVGAGVAAALGLWLVLLAVTPGLRSVLPMRRIHPDVRAGLHRDAVALVLRDRAMEVAGVQSVRVRAHRRRADVRALSHFRDLDAVHADLDTVLTQAIRGLGLVRPPRLTLQVRRPGKKG
ncbi:DUF6286 domain-containing protein [Streptomyces sp. DSM 15324]|uniref:DUF6286 domain-containing protein n=1 Tax=Streptomyces sp. DSM 15324 TaxID=1739111 RepID=UPI00074A2430|nr:DUF6286 domain-containing protein [Streptomyces sp. DSM 15324]KUO07119.1 hypothetical protein AQJ58_37415 [Streptomyces sp. DSM 15324]